MWVRIPPRACIGRDWKTLRDDRVARVSRESAQETSTFHGGRLVARLLKAHGVSKLFTLSGGHLFSIYDGCREEGIDIVDVRHESTAAFAAEGSGVAAGDRPRSVRAPADEACGYAGEHAGDPGPGGRRVRGGGRAAWWTDVRGLSPGLR